MTAASTRVLPPVWLGPGAVSDPRGLARFSTLDGVLVPVGPVGFTTGPGVDRRATGDGGERRGTLRTGVGGVEHDDALPVATDEAEALLRWAGARGLSASVTVVGSTTGALASVVERLRRGVEADALRAVEVDLRLADDQTVLKSMARVREAAPRDLVLLARLAVAGPDLVTRARSAVAGGAAAVVVCGQVPLGPGRWWSGPSTLAYTLSGVRLLAEAAQEQRWPGAELIASGGVHDPASAVRAVAGGATAVQVGSALWADPTLLPSIRAAVLQARDHRRQEAP